MYKTIIWVLAATVCITTSLQAISAQPPSKEEARNTRPTITGVPSSYEPTPAFPYGRLNPNAPPETNQFAFMIGEFDCIDSIINPQTGEWTRFPAIWTAKYFLNGYGVQDQYWSPHFSTSNIRIFDRKEKRWMVTFFRMPGYSSGVWSGIKEVNDLVMLRGDEKQGSRLTFSGITKGGFSWVGESIRNGEATAFWKSSCKRRR
ncbi:MAG: hypothetical protein HKN25_12465 [Pyrinomonadaceae bacterium]|nr:hypothetical protein [Pyrinomonadaceae bacterium]